MACGWDGFTVIAISISACAPAWSSAITTIVSCPHQACSGKIESTFEKGKAVLICEEFTDEKNNISLSSSKKYEDILGITENPFSIITIGCIWFINTGG